MSWELIDKNIQNKIIWNYVCKTYAQTNKNKETHYDYEKPVDIESVINAYLETDYEKPVDIESVINAYLASKIFHVLKKWQKKLIPIMKRFIKEYSKNYLYQSVIYIHRNPSEEKFMIYSTAVINSYGFTTIEDVLYKCSQFGMGGLIKYILNNPKWRDLIREKAIKWSIDECMESGDIDTVCWLVDKYNIDPSKSSIDEAVTFGCYEVVRFCINRFKYNITDNVIIDSLQVNNTELLLMSLKENWIESVPQISNSIIFELIQFGAFDSISCLIEKNVITDKLIETVFLIYYKNKSLDDVSYYKKVKWLNNVSKISLKLCNKLKKNDTSFYEERRKIMAY